MFGTISGITWLAATFLVSGLAGVFLLWIMWPRNSSTSPLAALFLFLWSCTYLAASVLTWRRSRFAAPASVAAMGLLVPVASFLFQPPVPDGGPGGGVPLLPFLIIPIVSFLLYRVLRRAHERAV